MGSNKNRNDKVNIQNTNKLKNNEYKTMEIDESDKIIEQLNKIEKLKDSLMESEREDMSSRVRNMLKSDKEAIQRMREQMAKLDEDDELDYLDDEKIDMPAVVKQSDEKKSSNTEKENTKEEEDVNLDFFENMARQDDIHYNKIRKVTPNRLKKNGDTDIKEYFTNNIRNMVIVTTIAVLLLIMFIALFTTGKKDNKNYNFIEIDESGFVTAINDYYNSLGTGNVDDIRKYIYEGKKLTDADILKLTEEQMFLSEFFFSDILEKPFEITDCYVLEGMKKKEYIVLMKYQFTIKDCVEPAVGIFSWYIVDVSMSDTPVYKISTKVGDTSSKIYKYVCEMENSNLVIGLVEDVNKELVESCKKDEVLRKIIFNMYDEMVKSGDKIDNSFRKMIAELKEYEENN